MKITKKHRDIFMACAMGDGHISKGGAFIAFHSERQKAFVEYKAKLLGPMLCSRLTRVCSGRFPQVGISCRTSKFTKAARRWLYPNGKKRISAKAVRRLSPLTFAIWWMDDGSLSVKRGKTGRIKATVSTLSTCVSREENQVIIDELYKKFGVKFGQRKLKSSYALICGTREGRKLRDVLSPYIIPSMRYKIECVDTKVEHQG